MPQARAQDAGLDLSAIPTRRRRAAHRASRPGATALTSMHPGTGAGSLRAAVTQDLDGAISWPAPISSHSNTSSSQRLPDRGLHAKRRGDRSQLIAQRGSARPQAPPPVTDRAVAAKEPRGPTLPRIVRVFRYSASTFPATHTRANVQPGSRRDSKRAAAARLPHRGQMARMTATAGTRGPLVSTPGRSWPLRAVARSFDLTAPVGASTAPQSDRTASAGRQEPSSALRLDVPRETLPARLDFGTTGYPRGHSRLTQGPVDPPSDPRARRRRRAGRRPHSAVERPRGRRRPNVSPRRPRNRALRGSG